MTFILFYEKRCEKSRVARKEPNQMNAAKNNKLQKN